MKFTCSQQALNKEINTVSKAVSSRTTIPILKCILLNVHDGVLTLTASDLDLSIKTSLCVQSSEDGSAAVNAKLFADIVRRLPNALITMASDESGKLHISCLGSDFDIVCLSAENFPSIGSVSAVRTARLNKNEFIDIVKKTSFAASIDEKKGILVGCLIKFLPEKIEIAALDGFRMAVAGLECSCGASGQVIIPARILSDVSRLLSEIEADDSFELIMDEKRIEFDYADTVVTARLLEGDFIKYEDVLPKQYSTRFIIDRAELQAGIERASLFSREGKNNLIKLAVTDSSINITSQSEEGSVNENISIEKTGGDLTIGFNSKYIMDVLKAVGDDELAFEMTNAVSSCLIKPTEGSSYTYLVLPVRISAV